MADQPDRQEDGATKRGGPKVTRRELLYIVSAVVLVEVDAFAVEPRWLEVSQHDLHIPDLPDELYGFKIAQITDLHLRSWDALHDTLIEHLKEQKPDLLVLTGDIIDKPEQMPLFKNFCKRIRDIGEHRVAILGNWEHWGEVPISGMETIYREQGIHFLRNASLPLSEEVVVAGSDDFLVEKMDLEQTFRDVTSKPLRLFLTHSPGFLSEAPKGSPEFDLVLAGHTHGGQFRLGPWAPFLPEGSGRFVSGFYDTPFGKAYVGRGIGTTFLPARLFCRPELPVFTFYPS